MQRRNKRATSEKILGLHDIKPLTLHKEFSASTYGRKLAGSPRFDFSRPAHVSKSEWIEQLGRDADNLSHLEVTYRHALRLLRPALGPSSVFLSADERKLVLVTAITHDWAEAVIGDIYFHAKTSADLEEELRFYKEICKEFGISDNVIQGMEAILRGSDKKLGAVFNAVERLGYLSTAVVAYKWYRRTSDNRLKDALCKLCISVTNANFDTMMELAKTYDHILSFLSRHQMSLRGMCELAGKQVSDDFVSITALASTQ